MMCIKLSVKRNASRVSISSFEVLPLLLNVQNILHNRDDKKEAD